MVMEPLKVGRTLGIGLRAAGHVAGRVLSGEASAASLGQAEASGRAGSATAEMRAAVSTVQQTVQAGRTEARQFRTEIVGKAARKTGRGVGGFIRPFARIGHILWLEVVGAIFLFIALFVGQNLWRVKDGWQSGPNHQKFLLIAGLLALFLYLGVSSFWRARRK